MFAKIKLVFFKLHLYLGLFPCCSTQYLSRVHNVISKLFFLAIKTPSPLARATLWLKVRSSRPEVFCRKGVLRKFAKFTGKHLCQSLFLKKRLWHRHRCFPLNFVKFLKTHFLKEHLWWLLLLVV